MITSAFVTQLRRTFNDLPKLHKDTRNGDGDSTVYKTKYAPIKEGSVTLKVNNVTKTEGLANDFTLDYDTGDIQMTAAPTNGQALDVIYKEVNFRDAHWLDAIAQAYQAMGDQFFGTVIMNTSSMRLSAGLRKFNMPSNCIRLLKVFESSNLLSSGTYIPLRTNWEYDRRANQLVLGQPKTVVNFAALSYLTKITAPSAVGMTLPGEENWQAIVREKAGAAYLRSMADRIAQQGNATVEEGHFNPAVLRALANDHEQQFEILRKRHKPIMPNLEIPYWDPNGGQIPR